MRLCSVCNQAAGSGFEEGDCEVCGGKLARLEEMGSKAVMLLKAGNAASFSISTNMDKEWLAREERVFDRRLSGAESVKGYVNRLLAARLRKETGAEYSQEGECRIVLDFARGEVTLERNESFYFGRYRKLAQGLSQSRWICSNCEGRGSRDAAGGPANGASGAKCPSCGGRGRLYESVEERIGEPFMKASGASGYVMHASGREDVDATNSAGRAFVLELSGPKTLSLDIAAISAEIAARGDVTVSDLRRVSRSFVEVVTESHFDKTYEAEVEFGRDIGEDDAAAIRSMEGRTILQRTPQRVAHRRSDLVRHRKVKHLEFFRKEGQDARHGAVLVKAEAGTYIKELISGDSGRTNPSISGLLKTTAACTRLEVVAIDDGYLDFCLEGPGNGRNRSKRG